MIKKLKWKHHVSIITAKANQCRQMLQRNLVSVDSSVKLNCYKSIIRPIVEFASPVWDPVGNKDLQQNLNSFKKKLPDGYLTTGVIDRVQVLWFVNSVYQP